MTRNPILRLAVVAALGLVIAGPARAAGPEVPSLGEVPQALSAAWEWLQGLWSGADLGCDIDPNGNPRCAPVTAQSDHGCGIDPNGKPRCAPVTAQADHGCDIDPDGKPRCSPGM